MSSKENLTASEIISEPLDTNVKEINTEPSKEPEREQVKEDIEMNTNGTHRTSVILSPVTEPSSEIVIKSDINDFIEVHGPDKYDTACVSSFRLEFSDVSGISTVSPTKAWIQGTRNLKLVDIEQNKVIRSYYSNIPFWNLCGIDENTVLFTATNSIVKFHINDNNETTLEDVMNLSTEGSKPVHLNVFGRSNTGDILACITRKMGCACFAKEVSFVGRYDIHGRQIAQAKIRNKGKHLIREAYEIVENKNGDICIAGEKAMKKYEFWVVVLDSNFKFRFEYDRNTSTQVHVPSSLAIDTMNNIVVVNKFRDRTKKMKSGLNTQKKKELTYIALIDENGIFRQHPPTEGFVSEGPILRVDIDNEDQAWMITESGQIIVWAFKKAI